VQAVEPAFLHVLVSSQSGENLVTHQGQLKCLFSSPEPGRICFSQDFHSYFYHLYENVHIVFIYGNVLLLVSWCFLEHNICSKNINEYTNELNSFSV